MELTALLQKLVANTPRGLEIALAEINSERDNNMSAQVLNNKLNPYYTSDHPNAPQIEAILRSNNLFFDLAQWSALKANAVVVPLPQVDESAGETSDAFMQILRELGELTAKYQEAYKDKKITRKEWRDIAREFEDVFTAVAHAKALIEASVK